MPIEAPKFGRKAAAVMTASTTCFLTMLQLSGSFSSLDAFGSKTLPPCAKGEAKALVNPSNHIEKNLKRF